MFLRKRTYLKFGKRGAEMHGIELNGLIWSYFRFGRRPQLAIVLFEVVKFV
jgi:hypothetical protein